MNRNELYWKIKATWPNVYMIDVAGSVVMHGNAMVVDEKYHLPYMADAEKIIFYRPWWKFWINPSRIPEKSDCDEWTLKYMYDVRTNFTGDGVLAYGMIGGKFNRISLTQNHLMCMLVCQDGIMLHDPSSGRIWKADPNEDKAWFWFI